MIVAVTMVTMFMGVIIMAMVFVEQETADQVDEQTGDGNTNGLIKVNGLGTHHAHH